MTYNAHTHMLTIMYVATAFPLCTISIPFQATAVTSLVISHNQLTTLPLDFGTWVGLRELDLGSNQLQVLPGNIVWQSWLLTSHDLIVEDIMKLVKLERLVLSNNLLRHLPKGICALRELQVLELDGNRLESLVSEISYLRSLKRLNVQSNRITYLPRGLG